MSAFVFMVAMRRAPSGAPVSCAQHGRNLVGVSPTVS
ncbi:hypothetical protein FPT12_25155 [Pseudomonas sp. H3(2019)]|nr:hypothetical protein FPT12_25155 [Pseudomonas sp. H3(2019)]